MSIEIKEKTKNFLLSYYTINILSLFLSTTDQQYFLICIYRQTKNKETTKKYKTEMS
jgi:hypothetical protein